MYQNNGKCPEGKDCGFTEFSRTYKTGRSSSTTVTQTTTEKLEANIGVEYEGVSAGIAASYETSFSTAVTNAAYEEEETT